MESPTATTSIPVVAEERLHITKTDTVTARVTVSTHVEALDDVVTAELRTDSVDVVRVPVGTQVIGPLPTIRQNGDVTIVPVFEEVLFVERRLILKEEVHITRHSSTEVIDTPVAIRRQGVSIERSATDRKP